MVIEVGDVQAPVWRDCHAAWCIEGTGLRAAGADKIEGLPVRGEHLDAVAKVLGDVKVAVWSEAGVHRPIELAELAALLAPGGHERAVSPEPLDTVVPRVGDVDVLVGADGYTDGPIELPRSGACLTPRPHRDKPQASAGEEQSPGIDSCEEQETERSIVTTRRFKTVATWYPP